jgi:hypothetical protein
LHHQNDVIDSRLRDKGRSFADLKIIYWRRARVRIFCGGLMKAGKTAKGRKASGGLPQKRQAKRHVTPTGTASNKRHGD